MLRYLAAIFAMALLFGCLCPAPEGNGGAGNGGTDGAGNGDSGLTGGGTGSTGGDVIVVDGGSSGGMSDPSKCNNLPPQQMADCLEQAMGN